jgi:hypothetical protein
VTGKLTYGQPRLIAALERCLDDFRWAREKPGLAEHETFHALRQLCGELRERDPRRVPKRVDSLRKMIEGVKASRASDGQYSSHALHMLGTYVVARWPMIEQALERYAADLERCEEETTG